MGQLSNAYQNYPAATDRKLLLLLSIFWSILLMYLISYSFKILNLRFDFMSICVIRDVDVGFVIELLLFGFSAEISTIQIRIQVCFPDFLL